MVVSELSFQGLPLRIAQILIRQCVDKFFQIKSVLLLVIFLQKLDDFKVVTLAPAHDVVQFLVGEVLVFQVRFHPRFRGERGTVGLAQRVLILLALVATRLTGGIRYGDVGISRGRHDSKIMPVFPMVRLTGNFGFRLQHYGVIVFNASVNFVITI